MREFIKIANAIRIIELENAIEKSAAKAGKVGIIRSGLKAIAEGAKRGQEVLSDAGHPIVGAAFRFSPEAAAAYTGWKGYKWGKEKILQTPTGQKLQYKYHLWKARRAQRKAMGL